MCAINDPLGQTQSPASSDYHSHLKIVLFSEIFKKWGLTDSRVGRPRGSIQHMKV